MPISSKAVELQDQGTMDDLGNTMQQQPDISVRWIQYQRRNRKSTKTWSCTYCPDRRIFASEETLWEHAQADHRNRLAFAENGDVLEDFKRSYIEESRQKK